MTPEDLREEIDAQLELIQQTLNELLALQEDVQGAAWLKVFRESKMPSNGLRPESWTSFEPFSSARRISISNRTSRSR